jgi:hypothetical protein
MTLLRRERLNALLIARERRTLRWRLIGTDSAGMFH